MMCGLFGFFGRSPDPDLLALAATLAAKRGPDGWGVLTDVSSERGLGRLPYSLARTIVAHRFAMGHCRLATVLGTKQVGACQPLMVGRYVVTHNGTVGNADALVAEYGYRPATRVDSEAIPQLLHCLTGTTEQRLNDALELIDHGGHYAVAVLDLESGSIHLRAQGIPLWVHRATEGVYWCSIQPAEDWEACP
jgi:asparagine synthetase B (glutamine-hydrolysing)